ncbi:MAG: PQQ-dependent sugar dehydrogenase [Planctomycetota bacterium]|nr:PQQ-dependent sugar dehydrogenase [Planctomycetota bacterium]
MKKHAPRSRRIARGLAALLALAASAAAQFPANFASLPVGANWQQPVGLAFTPSGSLLVWEKAGRVWSVVNGVKSAQPVLDISEEVGDWRDHGLLGFAVDPDFAQNGRVYAGYVVDYHHLRWFGTPQYSPTTNEYFRDTIARVTRFALDPGTLVQVQGSRAVLLGESMTTGIPICNQSHGMGSLVFGADGTLLVSCGDGASYDAVDSGGPAGGSSNTALLEGILRPKEDVGAFRAQLVDALNGKVLRIDPATGDGVRSNPFFDAAAPRAARSRVWALGLRNPFRMSLQPGTGVANPLLANPGTLWIGDVGWNAFEELDVCDAPGLNFGWPLHEGLEPQVSYGGQTTSNLDAPNPLFGTGSCGAAYFAFRDLLVQDTLAAPAWPNPCNPAQQVPTSIPRFEHARPVVDWGHGTVARAKSYAGVTATIANVGAPGSPVQGPQFNGDSITGGAWYAGTEYPASYSGSYFFADYVGGWIRRFVPGAPAEIVPFASGAGTDGVVNLVAAPGSGALHYIRYAEFGGSSEVRRVVYAQNLPPIAVATPPRAFGPVPLAVQFSSAGSSDPEGQPLTYAWDFGDGTTSTLPDPTHVYEPIADVTSQGTIVARVLELDPPHPLGGGNWDPEILRDGDLPPVGSTSDSRQYDTYHAGAQGNFDWIGYAFAAPHAFRGLVFQEGQHFSDGGWFDTWRVEVGDGSTWSTVAGAVATPAYPGNNGLSYETFRIDFPAATGTHIRIAGAPGGSAHFLSAGELRVLAEDPTLLTQPTRRDVTLTVRDPLNASATVTTLVSLNNTPPSVSITSPVDGSLYTLGPPATIALSATISDAEHAANQLTCAWQTVLHHDEHTHPEPIDSNCSTSTVITPEGCDGQTYHFEVLLTVTDAAGLSTTDEVHLYPDCAPLALCKGDGTGAACPCGNSGASGRGCDNSFGTGGGLLAASGSARTSSDTLRLAASGMPPLGAALFFQGDSALAGGLGAPFGDGLRCAGGAVQRLAVVDVQGGSAAFGSGAGGSLSALGSIPAEGAVRTYQAWYRNAAVYCTASAFNLTNGLRVTWIP